MERKRIAAQRNSLVASRSVVGLHRVERGLLFRYYYISRSWMVSTTSQRVFKISAWFSIGLLVLLLLFVLMPIFGEFPASLAGLLLYPCALGAALVTVAMEYFLFGFDPSSAGKKAFWFLVIFFPFLGAALYCLISYARSPILDKGSSPRPQVLGEEFRG